MANLTISVDDDVLRRARMRARQEHISVNAALGRYLEADAGSDEVRRRRQEALDALLALAEHCEAGRGGKTWTRDVLHEDRAALPRSQCARLPA